MIYEELQNLLQDNGSIENTFIDFKNRIFSFVFKTYRVSEILYYQVNLLKFFKLSYGHDITQYSLVGSTAGLWIDMGEVVIKPIRFHADDHSNEVYEVYLGLNEVDFSIWCEKIDYKLLYAEPRENITYSITQ